MRRVYVGDSLQVRLVLGLLQQNGIPAMIQGDALVTASGELLSVISGPGVWIANDEDEERAFALIEANKGPVNPPSCTNCGYLLRGLITPRCPECGTPFRKTEPWTCPACGQTLEGQFTECWNCGTSRPDS